MFETLQSPPAEPARNWRSAALFGSWCALGFAGFLISFGKHGSSRPLGLFCYAAVFILAMYFLVTARVSQPTPRALLARCLVLLWLSLVPSIGHTLLM